MNTQHNFVIDRPLAQHCAELFHSAEAPVDPGEQLDDFVRQFIRQASGHLPLLTGGKTASVKEVSRESGAAYELAKAKDGPRNFLSLRGEHAGCSLLMFVDRSAALALMDQAFGGDGTLPDSLPDTLPRAVEPVLTRLAGQIAVALNAVNPAAGFALTAQGDELKKVIPFASTSACETLEFQVAEEGRQSWTFAIAFDPNALPGLLGSSKKEADQPVVSSHFSSAIDGACSEIPLTLDAVLAQIRMPVSRVAKLKPGDVLPIAMPREVALRVAGRPFARGPIGTQHDQIALQLTQMETPRGKSQ